MNHEFDHLITCQACNHEFGANNADLLKANNLLFITCPSCNKNLFVGGELDLTAYKLGGIEAS